MLTWSTFVLQRRVNQPFGAVGRIVCDPWLLARGTRINLDGDAVLRLEEPFGVTFPVFGWEGASWLAPATIRTSRGRRLEDVEIELNAWDEEATELVVHRAPARRTTGGRAGSAAISGSRTRRPTRSRACSRPTRRVSSRPSHRRCTPEPHGPDRPRSDRITRNG